MTKAPVTSNNIYTDPQAIAALAEKLHDLSRRNPLMRFLRHVAQAEDTDRHNMQVLATKALDILKRQTEYEQKSDTPAKPEDYLTKIELEMLSPDYNISRRHFLIGASTALTAGAFKSAHRAHSEYQRATLLGQVLASSPPPSLNDKKFYKDELRRAKDNVAKDSSIAALEFLSAAGAIIWNVKSEKKSNAQIASAAGDVLKELDTQINLTPTR